MAECKQTGEPARANENSIRDDKQFNCGICIGRYRNPRYLPTCGHTFCENCLLKYTRNIQQEQGSKFGCPVCRKPNDLPEQNEVTLQWVQTFPLNTVIIKMMETLPQSSEEMTEERRICDPCKEEGETIVGLKFCLDCKEVLCKTCTKYHKNFKMSKDHKLIDVIEMSAKSSQKDFFIGLGKCAVHPERDVEFYCKTHDVVICSLCFFQHNNCGVTEIQAGDFDAANLQEQSELLKSEMNAAIEHLDILQKLRTEFKNNFKLNLKEIREKIEHVRDQVAKLMDNIVSHVANITKQIEIEKEDSTNVDTSRLAIVKEKIEENFAILDTIGQHGSDRHAFVSAHLMKKQLEQTSKQISEEDKRLKQLNARLVLADDLRKLVECTNVKKLVQIKVTEIESSHTPLGSVSNTLRDSKLVKFRELRVRPDGNSPQYCGVAIHSDGRVILSDNRFGYQCLYNPVNRTVLNLKNMYCQYHAAEIDKTHLAVCDGRNCIRIMTVGNKLREEKTLQTRYNAHGIVALKDGQFAVAWQNPPAFGVIQLGQSGVVEKSYLDQDTSGRKFKSFGYLAVDEERQHVIQPCTLDKAVFCFDFAGKPVFMYKNPGLTNPHGVALDKCGNIYVCENNSPGSIHKLSPAGDLISIMTEGVPSYPSAICSDVAGTGFWVTQCSDPSDRIVYFRQEP